MKNFAKLGAVVAVSLVLAGCEQPASTNNEAGTADSEAADGAISGAVAQPANAMGIGTVEEPDKRVPLLDPTLPPQVNGLGDQPKQNDDVLEQPADTVPNAPQ